MGEITQRRVAGAAVVAMAVAGIVGVTSLSVSGQTTSPPEATKPLLTAYGTLTINLADRDGTYSLVDPDGNLIELPDPTVPADEPVALLPNPETIVTSQPCATVQPGTGGLFVLTPNPDSPTSGADTVQVRSSAFGVNTGNTSCGSSAAAVLGRNEQLKIELGPNLPAGVYAKSASLELTQLKRGDLKWKVDGGPLSAAIPVSQDPVLVAPSINKVDDLFTSITVQSTSNRDNEGLSVFDGTSFELVTLNPDFEVAVDCGEKVTEVGDGGDVADTVVYLRGQNESKVAEVPCKDVGVIVEILPTDAFDDDSDPDTLGGRVYWDNSFTGVDGSAQTVQGTVTIEWAPIYVDTSTQAEIDALLERQIDYDGPGGAAGFTDTLWCLSFTDESTFTLPLYDGEGANADGTAPWCLVSDERVLTNVPVLDEFGEPVLDDSDVPLTRPAIIQTEVLAGKGDPWRL